MTWVKQAPAQTHRCTFPIGGIGPNFAGWWFGHRGELWRCDECGVLWSIELACDTCHAGYTGHRGQCAVGNTWRPAGWWTRLRYRRRPAAAGTGAEEQQT